MGAAPALKHFAEIPQELGNRSLVRSHEYQKADGSVLCVKGSYGIEGSDECTTYPFTPALAGGYFMCEPGKASLSKDDRHTGQMPLYRLAELRRLRKEQKRQVWVVHDELTADLVAALPADPDHRVKGPASGPPPVTCVFSQRHGVSKLHLRPLYRHPVLMLACGTDASRSKMREIGAHLAAHGSQVKYFSPPGEEGESIADRLQSGGWPAALSWIQGIGTVEHVGNPLAGSEGAAPAPPMERTPHFRVLGVHDGHVVFQLMQTGELYYCKDTQVGQIGVLQKLAPLAFWVEQSDQEGLTVKNRIKFADALLRAAQAKGIYDPLTNSHGRGAGYLRGGRGYYHLGESLLLENEETNVMDCPASLDSEEIGDEVFLPRPRISETSDESGREFLREAYAALVRYKFKSIHHARAFMGFLVSSLVGGMLDLRPMLWMLAGEDAGKTFLRTDFALPLLGNTLIEGGDTTEAGLAALVGNDSLPVWIDEFEPGSGRLAEEKWKAVLKSARLASAGESLRVRAGGLSGGSQAVALRYSMLVSSIHRPSLTNADFSRFYTCRLAVVGRSDEEFELIRAAMAEAFAGDKAAVIRSTIIRNAARIAHSAKECEKSLGGSGMKQRDRQMIAALTAGAGFASGDYEIIQRDVADRENTALTPLQSLLGAMVPVYGGAQRRTIQECLSLSTWGHWNDGLGQFDKWESEVTLGDVAARYGFRISYDRFDDSGIELDVALGVRSMGELLRGTDSENIDLGEYLRALPGMVPVKDGAGNRKRVRFAGAQCQVVTIPHQMLDDMGFIPPHAPDDPRREVVLTRPSDFESTNDMLDGGK